MDAPTLNGIDVPHYWGRTLARFGHTVRLMASQFVKPYVKTNKNDAADAEANPAGVLCAFSYLPAAIHAISVFHDENDDGVLNTNFVGLPPV